MYQTDIETVLRALAERLASGGVMAFLEYEHVPTSEVLMWPRSPSIDRLFRWTDLAFDVLGHQPRMGTRLPSLLRSVGLEPQPPYELTGAVYTGGLTGVLTASGVATEVQ